MDVLLLIKDKDFQKVIEATQFRESIVGCALARHYKFLFQPRPHSTKKGYSKSCDYGLIDPINSRAWRVEQKDCFHFDSIEEGKFSFELSTKDDNGSKRQGKLMYCDADKFVYSAPKIEQLFVFDWPPLKELLLDLYDQGKTELLSFERSNWQHDTCPVDLLLYPAQLILNQTSVHQFTYKELNIKHIKKLYD